MAEREMKRESEKGAWRRAHLKPAEKNAQAAIGWSSCTALNVCSVHYCSVTYQHALQPAAGAPISHALTETSTPGCLIICEVVIVLSVGHSQSVTDDSMHKCIP